ncbi:MAG: DNA-3-methyladenine glycosylase 2 family protein [Pelagibacteraceae bacterium TMED124]|nr:Fe-S cluster assembly protein HesB [Candidatus Neomarinimicrobiota bacterium]RPG19103.1 MAG: DNA-3-methyladenine glycosylase 2 family protein [Pelagibacteraceae bacterium TMED124]|tara:strand:- start:6508 stop:7119 length:612 start_codon:yes stop_codon:yes gene_type:complete
MNTRELNNAINFLEKDKYIGSIIKNHPKPKFNETKSYFLDLCKIIIYQQLSVKSAQAIYFRFLKIAQQPKDINPKFILSQKKDALRSIGISKQKTSYIIELANFFDYEKPKFEMLTDSQIESKLKTIKGIGQWTVDMFLMFNLHRMDLIPLGDLGIKKAFKKLFNLDDLPSNEFMIEKSNKWKPYRTIACCYLWRLVDDGDAW